ncbi:hypothetical protein LRP30_36640 [Bradyrhizobium sp. C-145]|uniref:hypothetical protein n=1 Tax=Bradyrhizobium sp. C-145 TaxID=574727 RepID=UPI00201B7266|nr:hypothetical protein [Bradyrhizobium sp. C-145]UQR62258.1 hypothetical protein LRP30_36640 [Bradyrhizobium sp. C-145]
MANDPLVFYSFDETSGSVAHDQQDGYDGGATHVPGVTGNALQFNGSSDYVSVADSPDWNFGSGDFTLEFWANFNSIPSGSAGQPGDVLIGQDEGGGTTNKWFFSGTRSISSSLDRHTSFMLMDNLSDPPPSH